MHPPIKLNIKVGPVIFMVLMLSSMIGPAMINHSNKLALNSDRSEIVFQFLDTILCGFSYQVDPLDTLIYSFETDSVRPNDSYHWFINGSSVSDTSFFSYTFPDSGGNYLVMLEVSSGLDTCSQSQMISILTPSVGDTTFCDAGFSFQVDPNNSLNYTFEIDSIQSGRSYAWLVGDSSVLDSTSFVYTFSPGTHVVELSVFNAVDTCSTSQELTVLDNTQDNPGFCDANFTFQETSSGEFTYSFAIDSIQPDKFYNWFVDETLVESTSSFIYTFPEVGGYDVRLSVFDSLDTCTVTQILIVSSPDTIDTDTIVSDALYIKGRLFADVVPIVGSLDLYKQTEDQWERVASVQSTEEGYSFEQLEKGNYLIHARGREEIHQVFLPTYFAKGRGWLDAYALDLYGSAEEVNVTLTRSELFGTDGVGTVEGRLLDSGSASSGAYVVFLMDPSMKRALKWAVSDEITGEFSFGSLPYGNYQLLVESPQRTASTAISITESQPGISVEMEIKEVITGLDEGFDELSALKIFPSFVEGKLSIKNTGSEEQMRLIFRSVSGKVLIQEEVRLGTGEMHSSDLSTLVPGVKLLQIVIDGGKEKNIKLIKK